jgi:hypothetical protein
MHTINPTKALLLSTTIDPAILRRATKAAKKLRQRAGRFEVYEFLTAVYRIYARWKRKKHAIRSARLLAKQLPIPWRKGISPIRVLIEAMLPEADLKQKSRWVRALEYAHSAGVPPAQLRTFFGNRGGVAGCAHQAVALGRKRRRPGGDWDD